MTYVAGNSVCGLRKFGGVSKCGKMIPEIKKEIEALKLLFLTLNQIQFPRNIEVL